MTLTLAGEVGELVEEVYTYIYNVGGSLFIVETTHPVMVVTLIVL